MSDWPSSPGLSIPAPAAAVLPEPKPARRATLIALLPTAIVIGGAEIADFVVRQELPFRLVWLVIAVVFAGSVGGLREGFVAACLTWAYLLQDAIIEPNAVVAEPSNLSGLFAGALVLPTVALMVGLLKDRLRSSAYAEAVARERHEGAQRQLQIEETLRSTEAQLAHLFTNLPEPAWVFDTESLRLLQVNEAAIRTYGYSREELLQKTITDLRPAEEVPRLLESLRANQGQARRTGPWRHVTRDGGVRIVEVSSLATSYQGRPARLSVIHDVTERIRERDTLAESEHHFHTLVDSTPALIWMCDRDGHTTFCNRAWLSFRGTTSEHERETDRAEAFHPDDAPRYREHLAAGIRSRRPQSIEFRMRRADGTYGWVLEQTLPRIGPDGAFEGLTGSCTDISDLHRAAELIRGNESAMRALLRAIPDPIFRMKRDGTYIGFSARPGVHLLLPPDDFIGKRAIDVLPREIGVQTMDAIARTLATGEASTFEYSRTRDSQLRHFEVRVVTCGPDEVLAMVRDMTDLRTAEAAVREGAERLRVQFDRMPMGCIVLDDERRILEWNPQAERIFGWRSAEVIGRDVVSVIVPESVRAHVEQIITRLRAGDMTAHSTNANITRDGRTITCEWYNTPIRLADGRPPGVLSMVRDVTEQLRIEEELRQSQKMDAIGQLASGVAHDFNNLLTAIFGHTMLARRTLSPGHPANTSLDRVEEAARQAGGVTRALLTFSREGAGEKVRFPLGRAVRDAVRLLRRTLPSNISLHATFEADGPPFVLGDPTQIQQVVLNLAINARDAMPSGGSLRISVSGASGAGLGDSLACLQVTDTGAGMTPEVQQRIFEPFFTTKPAGQGTGLGLAIVHGIIQDHGGRIEVSSQSGRGTTFRIMFPTVEQPSHDDDAGETSRPPMGNGELILIAEDHTYIREIIASMLTSLGYRVLHAGDVETMHALHQKHAGELRAVIIDADMPGCPGMQCVRDARARGVQTPAIIMSGAPQSVADLSHTVILSKPFQMHELAAAVARSLALHDPDDPRHSNGGADDGRQANLGAAGG